MVVYACWALSILMGCVLIIRTPPSFWRAWLAYSTTRSLVLLLVRLLFRYKFYAMGFAYAEPIDQLLLAATGIEIVGYRLYTSALIVVLVAEQFFPSISLPLKWQFLSRAAITGAVAIAVLFRAGWKRKFVLHEAILTVFCAADFICYISICAGSKSASVAWVMIVQTLCMVLWGIASFSGPLRLKSTT